MSPHTAAPPNHSLQAVPFRAEKKDIARSASPEDARRNPSCLEGTWLEIFKAGDYGERGTWTPEDLDRLAASYNPRLQPAPVVVGHPADDAPAYGWVRRLRRAGQSLWAQLEKVDPGFESLLRAGRFRQRSVALYTHFPPTGGPYLRHLGFLGAAPPAVKALAPARFADPAGTCGASITFAFPHQATLLLSSPVAAATASPEDPMSESKPKLDRFVDHLRAFFRAEAHDSTWDDAQRKSGRGALHPQPAASNVDSAAEELSRPSESVVESNPAACPEPCGSKPAEGSTIEGAAFAERLQQLENRLDSLGAEKQAAEEKLAQAESTRRQEQIAHFVETLRRQGRFPPAFEGWGVREFMERLAAADTAGLPSLSFRAEPEGRSRGICFWTSRPLASPGVTETEEKGEEKPSQPGLVAWFQEFLTKLPAVIEFRELGPSHTHGLARRSLGDGRSGSTSHASHPSLVRFTEPQRGMTVDPASIELAERAEALAAELDISYAEALTQLRQEHRHTITTA